MLNTINPTTTSSWKKLQNEYNTIADQHMKSMFTADTARFDQFHIRWNDFLVDYSKNRMVSSTINHLLSLAKECKLDEAIKSMFSGEKINQTENRSVLHIALRNRSNAPILVNGRDVMPDVNAVLDQMKKFTSRLQNGEWTGYQGHTITDIVNIGIGGGEFGPERGS